MKKMFFLLIVMMALQTAGVSQASQDTPLEASPAYTTSNQAVTPSNGFTDSESGMEFVHVTGGCYCMGAVANAVSRDTAPVHQVCIDDYYIGKYEVTQAQWRAIMGSNPSTMNSCGDNCPVVDVSWNEAQEFTRRLSERTGKVFRLPTEAEWEYAVRSSGTQAKNLLASAASSAAKPGLRPVGWSKPNGFGIYDLQGSVWEWTADRYSPNYYRTSPTNNPEGPSEGNYRVLRGGSWVDTAQSIQPTLRIKYEPWIKRAWVGLRLLSPDQSSAKYKFPNVLAVKESAIQDRQCKPIQEALIR
jgi:formylglycine-generating enzyme required for sulfatase activity